MPVLFFLLRPFWTFTISLSLVTLQPVSSTFSPKKDCENAPNKMLCLPEDYSKFELPMPNGINSVEIGIDISDVLRINDKEYSVTFSSYFNVLWKEPRLKIVEGFFEDRNFTTKSNNDNGETRLLPVNLELINDLWVPNIYIYNLKTFKVVEVLNKHAGLWITDDNEVFYSQATHITFICPMRFDSFPLDTQKCKFQVGSYSYDDSKMVFVESDKVKGYVQTSRSIVLDYEVFITQLDSSDRSLPYGALGNYSLAGFEMVLHRYVSHYIITYYLPSGLFVVVSWISFVVPPEVIPGRMALLVTLFLVLVNIFNSVTTNTPKAEGLTAIEAWMLACILFVFGALVEYSVILFRRQTAADEELLDFHSSLLASREMKYNGYNDRYDYSRPSIQRHLQHLQQQQQQQQQQLREQREATRQQRHQEYQSQRVQLLCRANDNKYEVVATSSPGTSVSSVAVSPIPTPARTTKKAKTPPPPPPRSFNNQSTKWMLLEQNDGDDGQSDRHVEAADALNKTRITQPRDSVVKLFENKPDVVNDSKERKVICGDNYLKVDRFFLVVMPMLFFIFNVIYWMSYGSHFFFESRESRKAY